MNCKKCGTLLGPTDLFCKKCGEAVNNTNVSNSINNQFIQPQNQAPTENVQMNNIPQMGFQTNNNQNMNLQNNNGPMQPQQLNTNIQMQQNNMLNQQNQTLSQQNQPNYAQPIDNSKKNKSPFIIIVIILSVIIIGLVVALVSKSLSSNNPETPSTEVDNSNPGTVDNNTDITDNSNKYEFKNFLIPIPDNYVATTSEGLLQLLSRKDSVIGMAEIISGYTLSDVEDELANIKAAYMQSGYNITSSKKSTYDGIDCLVLSISKEQNGQIIELEEMYTTIGSYHIAQMVINNQGSLSNKDVITLFAKMFKNTTAKGSGQFSPDTGKEPLNSNLFDKLDSSLLD